MVQVLDCPQRVDGLFRLVGLETFPAKPRHAFEAHTHPFDELCFTTAAETSLIAATQTIQISRNALCYFKAGTFHDVRSSEEARFWILHFERGSIGDSFPTFLQHEPLSTSLTAPQAATFRQIFSRLFSEYAQTQTENGDLISLWLRVLLAEMQSWVAQNRESKMRLGSAEVSPDLMRMYSLIREHVSIPGGLAKRVEREIPNYDSLRHSFKGVFGVSPKQMLLKLRMRDAQAMLRQTNLSVKDISNQVGYTQQHEFTRAFRNFVGCSPTQWKENPSLEEKT